MKWERRNKASKATESLASELPVDYLRLVAKTLTEALDAGLAELKKTHPISTLKANGTIYADEVLLAVTLSHGKTNLAATTVYASANYNPNSDKPGLEATLSACLDGVGSVFEHYLDPKNPEKIAQIAHASLSALEEGPFEWSQLQAGETQKISVWVKVDKSNPELDSLAEDWLKKNDPEYKKKSSNDEAESEEFLEERINAIKAAKSGSGPTSGGGSGPITH